MRNTKKLRKKVKLRRANVMKGYTTEHFKPNCKPSSRCTVPSVSSGSVSKDVFERTLLQGCSYIEQAFNAASLLVYFRKFNQFLIKFAVGIPHQLEGGEDRRKQVFHFWKKKKTKLEGSMSSSKSKSSKGDKKGKVRSSKSTESLRSSKGGTSSAVTSPRSESSTPRTAVSVAPSSSFAVNPGASLIISIEIVQKDQVCLPFQRSRLIFNQTKGFTYQSTMLTEELLEQVWEKFPDLKDAQEAQDKMVGK